jgi:hypothetical protein
MNPSPKADNLGCGLDNEQFRDFADIAGEVALIDVHWVEAASQTYSTPQHIAICLIPTVGWTTFKAASTAMRRRLAATSSELDFGLAPALLRQTTRGAGT